MPQRSLREVPSRMLRIAFDVAKVLAASFATSSVSLMTFALAGSICRGSGTIKGSPEFMSRSLCGSTKMFGSKTIFSFSGVNP